MSTTPAEKEILRRAAQELWGHAVEKSPDSRASQKGHIVYWRMKQDEWWTVRCCGVHITSPGCYRFTNRGLEDVPKTVWPLPIDPQRVGGDMEVTIHESELIPEFFGLMIELACDLKRELPHPAFQNGTLHACHSWSVRAWAHAESLSAEQRGRQIGRDRLNGVAAP